MSDPLWVDPEDARYQVLSGTRRCDVAIVGGGLAGVGAAYALRNSDTEVVLLEERTLASGASGRNAGFVLAGPSMPFGAACAQVGTSAATEVWRLTVGNNRLLAELVERYSIDCGYLRRGSMSLGVSEDELTDLVETAVALRAAGIHSCLVDAADLPVPFDRLYAGGVYYPGNAELNPAAFVRGVARAISASVSVFERTTVLALRPGSPHVLVTPAGEVHADAVVLATNAYTPRLLAGVPIAATRGQVLATAPLHRVIAPFPMYANYGYQYWRQTVEGRLVVGGWRDLDIGTEVGTEETLHAQIQRALDAFTTRLAGETVEVERRWAGIMGFVPDGMPLVGAIPGLPRTYLAAGYSGHGVSMAFTCGGLAAQLAIGGEAALPDVFDPGRFQTALSAT